MRTQLVALFLLSVVACNAAVDTFAIDFISSFLSGVNVQDFNQTLNVLQVDAAVVVADAQALAQAVQSGDDQAAEKAFSTLVGDFRHAIQDGSAVTAVIKAVLDKYTQDVAALDQNTLSLHILTNLPQIGQDGQVALNALETEDGKVLGATLANLLNLVVYGQATPKVSARRSLLELGDSNDILMIVLNAVLLDQGFFETANTTVNVDTYTTLLNDATYVALLVDPIIKDIKSMNISQLLLDGSALAKQVDVVRNDASLLLAQLSQWAARDLPIFEDTSRFTNGLFHLFLEASILEANVANVKAAWANADYEGTGKAIGVIFNQVHHALDQ